MGVKADDTVERLRECERQAEAAYTLMYDAINSTAAAGHYSDAKEAMADAIGIARRIGDDIGVARLERRLAHIKAVFRAQFS
jgi:hypothetical protein